MNEPIWFRFFSLLSPRYMAFIEILLLSVWFSTISITTLLGLGCYARALSNNRNKSDIMGAFVSLIPIFMFLLLPSVSPSYTRVILKNSDPNANYMDFCYADSEEEPLDQCMIEKKSKYRTREDALKVYLATHYSK